MSGSGLATEHKIPDGVAEYNRLKAAGFDDAALSDWTAQKTRSLQVAGFKPSEINSYWGIGDPKAPGLVSQVAGNRAAAGGEKMGPLDALAAGFNMSVTGLSINLSRSGRKPDALHPEDADLLNQALYAGGQMVGDLPATIAGFVGGAATGSAAGAATGPAAPIAVPVLAVGGAGFGSAALPEGMRQGLLDAYEVRDGNVRSWRDAAALAIGNLEATAKQGVIGAVSAPVGGAVGGKVAAMGAKPFVAAGADALTQAVTGTAVAGALDGEVPDAEDFGTAAILALGFHTAAAATGKGYTASRDATRRVQYNLQKIYVETGVPPWEAVSRAKQDPAFRQEVFSQDVNGNPVTPNFRAAALADPEPFKPAARAEPPAPFKPSTKAPEAVAGAYPANEAIDAGSIDAAASFVSGGDIASAINSLDPAVHVRALDDLAVATQKFASENDLTGNRIVRRIQALVDNAADAIEGRGGDKEFALRRMQQEFSRVAQEHPVVWEAIAAKWRDELSAATPAGTTRGAMSQAEAQSRLGVNIDESLVTEMKNVTPRPAVTKYAVTPQEASELLVKLEGSRDDSVSPVGAIGKHQIMPGTARQYMGKDFDVSTLFDPAVNKRVHDKIVADLHRRYAGDMTAIAIAYNAGPGRASQYMTKGEGTRLKAIPDRNVRSGIRYESEPAARDESFLPKETQKYLANGRRRSGGEMPGGGDGGQLKIPNYVPETKAGGGEGGGGGRPPGGAAGGGADEPGKPGFWETADERTLTEEILRNVGEAPKPKSLIDPDLLLTQSISELTPARRIDDQLIRAGEYDRNTQLGTEDMFRQTYASDARASVFVQHGLVDPITLDVIKDSPSFMKAARALKEDGGDMDGWLAWMLAKRTTDKAAQGVETGLNPRAAFSLAVNKAAVRKYERASKIFTDTMNGALDYAKGSGMFSQAQVDAMVKNNPTYVSMRRIMGDDASFSARGRGFNPRNSIHTMEGSDRSIVDPLKASIDNMRVLIKMADRNRAIGHVVGMAERGQLENLDVKRIAWDPKETIAEAGSNVFKPYGIEATPENLEAYGPLVAERATKAWGPNDFIFFRDGKPERWTTKSPQLAELLRKADSPGQANIFMKTAESFAALQRAGITLTPDFPVRNVLRDQIAAFVLDPLHPPPYVTLVKGLFHVLKQDDVFQDFMAKGGLGASLAEMDLDYLKRDVDSLFEKTGVWGNVANVVKHPVEFAQIVSERIDAASRLGYMSYAEGKGIESIKAATMARKAYLDFAERGTANIVNGMAQITPFFRPALLGLKQVGEAVKARPLDTALHAAAVISLPTIGLYMLNWLQDQELPEGERYSDLPRWQRDTFYITPSIGGHRFRLRYPQGPGFIFGGLVTRVLDHLAAKDPHAFDKTAKAFLNDFVPPLAPAIVETPAEIISNHNFFTGRPLVPASMEGASGYMQYTTSTSETAKAIARAMGPPGLDIADFSPIQVDHLVKGWSGTIGGLVLQALDLPHSDSKKPWELEDTPFVSSFLVRTPGMSAQPIQDFFDGMKTLETKQKDFQLAMRRAQGGTGDTEDVEFTAAAGQYAQAVTPIKEAIMTMSAAVQGINANEDLTPDEKRQLVDDIYPQMIAAAKMGIEVTEQIRADMKAAAEQPNVPIPDQEAPAEGTFPAAPPPVAENAGQVPLA